MFSGSEPGNPEKMCFVCVCVIIHVHVQLSVLGHEGTVGRQPGSGKHPGSQTPAMPSWLCWGGSRRVVWNCPTASLAKDTMVMSARANVTIRRP